MAEKAEFVMNKFNIATQRETTEISIFLRGTSPLAEERHGAVPIASQSFKLPINPWKILKELKLQQSYVPLLRLKQTPDSGKALAGL